MLSNRLPLCTAAAIVLLNAPAGAAVLTFSFVAEPFTNPECAGAAASDYCGGYAAGTFSVDEDLYGGPGSLAGISFSAEFASPTYFVPGGYSGDPGVVSASLIDVFSMDVLDPYDARAFPTLWSFTLGLDYSLIDIEYSVGDDYPDVHVFLSSALLRVPGPSGEEFLTAPTVWTVSGAPGPVVPLPAGAPLLALGLGALALVKRRRA